MYFVHICLIIQLVYHISSLLEFWSEI